MKKILFLFSVALLFQYSCTKKECKFDNPNYVFEIPSTFSPRKDTFNIGDTITITSVFGNRVYDRSTQETYALKNFEFNPEFKITKISAEEADESALFLFQVLFDSIYDLKYFYGTKSQILTYYGQYLYKQNTYSLELQIIPKDTGLFFFQHHSSINWNGAGNQDQEFEGKCDNKGLELYVKLNGEDDNNFSFLSNSPDEHINTWIVEKPYDRFYNLGGYVFYVK